MAFDITKRSSNETGIIDLVSGDGAPLLDDNGQQLSITAHGPGSKVWQQADADRSRRRVVRLEKNRKRMSAVVDAAREDEIEFLVAVTVSFNGFTYPGEYSHPKDMFRAAYQDDSIGYIRDHLAQEVNDWTAFTKGSVTN